MKLLREVGVHPNIHKLSSVSHAARSSGIGQVIVDTGRHHDETMSSTFFRDLGNPAPLIDLTVCLGSHVSRMAIMVESIGQILFAESSDCLVVYGNVNSEKKIARIRQIYVGEAERPYVDQLAEKFPWARKGNIPQ